MRLVPFVVTASIVGVVACALPAHAQDVESGRAVFASRCAACHGTEGGGGELGPSIVSRIPLRADADLEAVIREGLPGAGMPSFADLSRMESTNLIAFLRTLRPRAGTGPQRTSVMLADESSLSGVILNQSVGEMQILGDDRRAHLLRETTPGRYRAVTSQSGWTTYNGQISGNRYSALTEITADNVARLAPRWVFTLPNVSQVQVTPVVVDGLMYVSAANDLYALDAGSGRQIWNYRRPRTRGLAGVAARGVNRGVAVSGERVFMATDHAHLIALNRASGALLWETQMADWRQNYNGTGAPMVVGDLVIAGIAGGDEGARGFVAAYEQATGKEVWRFWAVPARDEPGWETWKGNAIDHPGAATWMTGSYDAELDTLYWAIGNPGPDMIGDDRQGDNLYSDSVVALDAKTGRRKWHFQFTPHDVHDYDAQQPIVRRCDVEGRAAQATAPGQSQRLLLRPRSHHRRGPLGHAIREEHHLGVRSHERRTADRRAEHGADARRTAGLPVTRGRVQLVLGVVQPTHGSLLRADQRQVRTVHAGGSDVGIGKELHGRHVCSGARTRAARAASDRHPDRKGRLGTAAVRQCRFVGRSARDRQQSRLLR